MTLLAPQPLGHRPDGAPATQVVQEVEGWIFGQRPAGLDDPLSAR